MAITSSASSFNDFSCNPPTPKDPPICRWGDYAGLTPDPDPAHTNLVWATQQYSAGNRWLTRNFAVQILAGGPKATLKVAPNPATAGKSVKFDGSASTDSLAPISAYNWDLDGNGTFETHTGASPKLNHTYHSAGKRRVRLRVIDANGDAADAGVTLAVVKPAACVSASKKRKQLASEVAQLKKRLKQAKTEDSRRRLRKQLDRKRAQLSKAHASESRACRF